MFNGTKKTSKKRKKKKNPKDVICPYFKVGLCSKGAKCKYSHDLKKESKSGKINLYHDPRAMQQQKDEQDKPNKPLTKEEDTIDNWDSEKLHQVISQNQKNYKSRNETRNVCNHFLNAVENMKYGWFWKCPNGNDCIYRHCLPPGYILKRDKQKMKEIDEEDFIPIEDQIETERTKIFMKGNGTAVQKETLEKLWGRLQTIKDKEEKAKLKQMTAKEKKKKSQQVTKLTGKQLFMQDPSLYQGEDEEEDEEEEEVKIDEKEEIIIAPQEENKQEIQLNDEQNGENQNAEIQNNAEEVIQDVEINEELFLEDEDIELPDDIE